MADSKPIDKNDYILVGVLSAMFIISFILVPPYEGKSTLEGWIGCPIKAMTGIPCPGCGITRSFTCISHGSLLESLYYHPIGWLYYIGFAFLLFVKIVEISQGKRGFFNWNRPVIKTLFILLIIAMVIAWFFKLYYFFQNDGLRIAAKDNIFSRIFFYFENL